MDILKTLATEMENEAATTRKMLSIIPDDKYDWQPHPKSMTIRRLATHIADISTWVQMAICDAGLDFANTDHKEPVINNASELLAFFDEAYNIGKTALDNATLEQLDEQWTLRNGDYVIAVMTRAEMIRVAYCQIVHHRAQLGVYLRLLNVPIPGSYGPSADEMEMQAEHAGHNTVNTP